MLFLLNVAWQQRIGVKKEKRLGLHVALEHFCYGDEVNRKNTRELTIFMNK